jgi:nucleoside phosphorylase
MASPRLRHQDYDVGWICALPIELAAAEEMLDEEHQALPGGPNDSNLYTLGRIGDHNIVIACLPAGQPGTNSTAAVATQMIHTFPSIRFGLMVGVGGGVPNSTEADIRLGDVVVSQPHQQYGGVVQYDIGKAMPNGFRQTGFLNAPPTVLLNALAKVQANHARNKSNISTYMSRFNNIPKFKRSNAGQDVLFDATYDHDGGPTCESCRKDKIVKRQPREGILVHYGTIASGNQVMRNGTTRDRVSSKFGGVLCFEMEAAGLMNKFPCLVIRGISDYADSHKNKEWQPYAAATSAAFAADILTSIPAVDVAVARPADETTIYVCFAISPKGGVYVLLSYCLIL